MKEDLCTLSCRAFFPRLPALSSLEFSPQEDDQEYKLATNGWDVGVHPVRICLYWGVWVEASRYSASQ
jgi:hypothetical protein